MLLNYGTPWFLKYSRGWSNSTVDTTLALHGTNLVLIPSTEPGVSPESDTPKNKPTEPCFKKIYHRGFHIIYKNMQYVEI